MSLKNLYQPEGCPPADAVNEAGGTAYRNDAKWRLTKIITTGMAGDTFYVDAKTTNRQLLELAWEVDEAFLAKAIVYGRELGHMRANPIQLLVVLSKRNPALFRRAFRRVIRTGGDLLDFATVVLSGQIRTEFGSAPRDEIRRFLNTADAYQFIKYGSNNQRPSLKDLIKMTHPKARDEEREHLFRWMLGTKDKASGGPAWDFERLPQKVQEYVRFQRASQPYQEEFDVRAAMLESGHLPHEAVSGFNLNTKEWEILARRMPYMAMLRHLNAMARRKLLENPAFLTLIAEHLSNETAILKARQFPYRLMMAYKATSDQLPPAIKTALGQAMEIAVRNVPAVEGLVVVAPDVSGSMHSPVYPESKVTHIDVAGLVTAAILKKNPGARLLPFDTRVHAADLNADDTIITNAMTLAKFGGGGTAVSLPFQQILDEPETLAQLRLMIGITDFESWVDARPYGKRATAATVLWAEIHRRNPQAQCLLINVAPYSTDQFPRHFPGITFVSGFSDEVFRLMKLLTEGGVGSQVEAIESFNLD